MRTREQLEKVESLTLEPYAARSSESKGRYHDEKEHEYRTAFQRDRDRIVHTGAFRRLEYKTQVFVNHEGDYYRTRLTHTLEVAQIGKTIARSLGVNSQLTEAICLAHDLGHTPFGHAGQDVMAELMAQYGGFEHNKQSFRIVTLLENPYPQYSGLNLSYEVLEGITKHSSEYDMPDGKAFEKSGFPSIEAQIGNFADEIAYNNHDIDDGLKAGLLKMEALQEIELWQTHYQDIQKNHVGLTAHQVRRMMVKAIINHLVTDLIHYATARIQELKIKTLDDVRERGKDIIGFSPETRKMNTELKRFLFSHLYRHYRVQRMAEKAKHVITQLFQAYTENTNILPEKFRKDYEETESVQRVVCDYIAGMTDRFALDEHSKLFDPHAKV